MAIGGDNLLGNQNFAADGAVAALGEAGFGAGGSLTGVGNGNVLFAAGTLHLHPSDTGAITITDGTGPRCTSFRVIGSYSVTENIGVT